jgi:hypothetical protein
MTVNIHPYTKACIKPVAAAPTVEALFSASSNSVTYAHQWLQVPVTLLNAWPYPSDFSTEDQADYAYVHIDTPGGETILCVGGNAGSQALTYARLGRLPMRRVLTPIEVNGNTLYVWRRVRT